MAAEPTSLGIGIAVAGAIAFGIWHFTKSRRKQKEEKKRYSNLTNTPINAEYPLRGK